MVAGKVGLAETKKGSKRVKVANIPEEPMVVSIVNREWGGLQNSVRVNGP